jgi:hypothetical protein
MRVRARKAFCAALTRGVGYERQPLGDHFDAESVRGYYTDLRSKTVAETSERPHELGPAALAQLGLGWLERSLAGDPSASGHAARIARELHSRAIYVADALLWPYEVAVPKYGLIPPWHSAMAQGQAASLFVRMHLLQRDEAAAEFALSAIAGLAEPNLGLIASSSSGPSLEEAPHRPPSRILNGWIYALWGVWDVAVGLGDQRAEKLFADSVRALEVWLPRYDLGWWSRYSIAGGIADGDIAKPFYHRLHVTQLHALHRLSGIDAFARTAEAWARAATRVNVARAVAVKAAHL